MPSRITVLRRNRDFRVSLMGNKVVVNFHKRYASLFSPLVWDGMTEYEVEMMEREAARMCSGDYANLITAQAYEQVEPVPSASLGIKFI